ncbi:MAG: RHS repeat protein [Anaerolineaceae bacterium]|nr:RHS repeat protein [Anaerolineaceae bacterium]
MVGYAYNGQGQRKQLTYADGKMVRLNYDPLHRLQTVTH